MDDLIIQIRPLESTKWSFEAYLLTYADVTVITDITVTQPLELFDRITLLKQEFPSADPRVELTSEDCIIWDENGDRDACCCEHAGCPHVRPGAWY